jgi:very-short-patch-repair endonuclease
MSFKKNPTPTFGNIPGGEEYCEEVIQDHLKHTANILREQLAPCQSPIERMLGVHLFIEAHGGIRLRIKPQAELDIDGHRYVADFLIGIGLLKSRLVVECDGHEFHERTKEQAAHDRSRDRAMLAAGYTVMRFTGTEIHADVLRCFNEIINFICSDAGDGKNGR